MSPRMKARAVGMEGRGPMGGSLGRRKNWQGLVATWSEGEGRIKSAAHDIGPQPGIQKKAVGGWIGPETGISLRRVK